MQPAFTVSWATYAQSYDLLQEYNPFYQQLHREIMGHLLHWDIPDGATLADIGAGTGNYSLAMARVFLQATVLHFDNDDGMNTVTAAKRPVSMTNHHIYRQSVDEIRLEEESLDGLISIHALYTFPEPEAVLQKMYQWLKPGTSAILVNPGRNMNVLSWQMAIGWRLFRQYGLRGTLEIMRAGKEVSRQNANIRNMQRRGLLWTPAHREFCTALRAAGFEIREAKKTYRGDSNLAVIRKP